MKEKQFKFCQMLGEFLVWLYQQGYQCQIGDAWRSTDKLKLPDSNTQMSYQELLLCNGKTKVKYGKHNDRLAIDLIISKDGNSLNDEGYRPIGEKWESMGGVWGGRFGVKKEEYGNKIGWDANHFEL
jgi:hypothetical protein